MTVTYELLGVCGQSRTGNQAASSAVGCFLSDDGSFSTIGGLVLSSAQTVVSPSSVLRPPIRLNNLEHRFKNISVAAVWRSSCTSALGAMANIQPRDVAKALRKVLQKQDGEAQKLSKVRMWHVTPQAQQKQHHPSEQLSTCCDCCLGCCWLHCCRCGERYSRNSLESRGTALMRHMSQQCYSSCWPTTGVTCRMQSAGVGCAVSIAVCNCSKTWRPSSLLQFLSRMS
jgi:hypothetical protein